MEKKLRKKIEKSNKESINCIHNKCCDCDSSRDRECINVIASAKIDSFMFIIINIYIYMCESLCAPK